MMNIEELIPLSTQAPQRPLLAAGHANALNLPIPLTISYGGTNATSQVTNGVNYFNGTSITTDSLQTFAYTNGPAFAGLQVNASAGTNPTASLLVATVNSGGASVVQIQRPDTTGDAYLRVLTTTATPSDWQIGVFNFGGVDLFTIREGQVDLAVMTFNSAGQVNIPLLTASSPVFTDASSNLTSTGVVSVAHGGTGSTSYTAGSVIFAGTGGTSLTQNNAQFFWDNTNHNLYIGANTSFSGAAIEARKSATGVQNVLTLLSDRSFTSAQDGVMIIASSPTAAVGIQDYGVIFMGNDPLTGDGGGALFQLRAGGNSSATSTTTFLEAIGLTTGSLYYVRLLTQGVEAFRVDVNQNTILGYTQGTLGSVASLTVTGRLNVLTTASTASILNSQTFYAGQDVYPTLHIVPTLHNNITLNFDAYTTNGVAYFSSVASTGNFQIAKGSSILQFNYANAAQAAAITWTVGLSLNTSGQVNIPSLTASSPVFTDASSNLTSTGVVPVVHGGTGISSGTSGGVPYFSSSTTIASSLALTASQLVIGGGAGFAPHSLAAGSTGQPLTIVGGVPTYAALNLGGGSAVVSGLLPVAFGGTGIGSGQQGGVPYFSSSTTIASSGPLAANQLVLGGGIFAPITLSPGTTGQPLIIVSGNPEFGALDLAGTNTVTGILPLANGGTGSNAAAFNDTGVVFCTGDTLLQTDTSVNTFDYSTSSTAAGLTVAANNPGATGSIVIAGGASGGTAELLIARTDLMSTALIEIDSSNAGAHNWQMGVFLDSENFIIFDGTNPSDPPVAALTIVAESGGLSTAQDVEVNAGNLKIMSRTKTLAVASAPPDADDALFVTGITLVGGLANISNAAVTAAHIGFVTRTSASVVVGSYTVSAAAGGFIVRSSSTSDTSTISVLFILPI